MARNRKPKPSAPSGKRSRAARIVLGTLGVLFRTFLFTVMLLLLLGGGLWVAALKMFNAQQISETLTQRLQAVLDRPVVISSLDLKFVNTVELKGFAVLDNKVNPGEPFLSAESVLIRYKLFPLLEHKLIVDEVTLRRPRINITRSEEGYYNVPPVKTGGGENRYVSAAGGASFEISIEDWRIQDGVLSYRDLGAAVTHAVYGLNMHFAHLRLNELSRFRLETVLRNRWADNISDLEIRGSGQVNFANFDWGKFALRNFRTQVSLFQKPVALTLDVDNLRTPFFSVRGKVPAFDEKDLSVFHKSLPAFNIPGSQITAKGRLDEGYATLKLTELTAKTDNMSLSASGEMHFAPAPVSFDLNVKTGWADLATLSRRWPFLEKFKLKGRGSLSARVKREDGKTSFPLVQIGAQDASGLFWGFEISGVSGDFSAKKDFTDLYAQTQTGRVKVAESVFDKVGLSASYRKGNLYAYVSSALLDGVPVKIRLSVDNIKSAKRKINTALYLKHFEPMKFIGTVMDFAEVISKIPKTPSKPYPVQTGDLAWMRNFRDRLPKFMPNFSGTLYADTFASTVLSGERFNAEFSFTGLLPGAAKLNGTLDMKLQDGVIHQMEKLAEEQQALNITFTPFIMMHRMERSGSFKVGEVLKDVAFNEMAASVDFKNGTMIINNAFTQGPVISAAVSGWTDWVRETFELVIWTMFTPSSKRGILAENLTDESGNPALAFKVSSSMLKPRLEMLRAKKTGVQIDSARRRGLRTDFKRSGDFVKGEFHAKK